MLHSSKILTIGTSEIVHQKSVIFDVVLNFLNKPLFEGWPTDYREIVEPLVRDINSLG